MFSNSVLRLGTTDGIRRNVAFLGSQFKSKSISTASTSVVITHTNTSSQQGFYYFHHFHDLQRNGDNAGQSKAVCRPQATSRCFCSESSSPSNKLPPLMDFPELVWPSVVKSLRNFVLATFIIKPYFDRDFTLPSFVSGSKQAIELVSERLSSGEMTSLDGLVTSDALVQLHSSISQMSLSQRQQIAVRKDDIYFSFPYQVGIMFNDQEVGEQKRFVEITMVYHTLRGLEAMRNRGEEPPLNMGLLPQYRDKISILNYRFIREFTKGVDDEWTINMLNHFKPVDLE